jgi:hypothetical protein
MMVEEVSTDKLTVLKDTQEKLKMDIEFKKTRLKSRLILSDELQRQRVDKEK